MTGTVDLKYVRIIILLFCILSVVQIAETFMKIDAHGTSDEGIVGFLASLPVVGAVFDFFTITIPDTPLIVTLILNIINFSMWVYFAITVNNIFMEYSGTSEHGILGGLFSWIWG